MKNFKDAEEKAVSLKEAVERFVRDGCSLTFGGFCGRNSQAAAYEIIRQRKRDLVFIDESPTDQLDMLIGAGCIRKVELAWHGVTIFAPAMNFRRSLKEGVPLRVEVEDYSNYAMGLRFLAGALNVPFMPLKSLLGSDIPKYNPKIKVVKDPYRGEPVALVPAANPDVAIIHVQRADRRGNAQIWGHLGDDENKARAAKHTIITCEELVSTEEITRLPNMTVIPCYCVDAVVHVPYGSHPWSCYGYYYHDILFQRDYAQQNQTREGFLQWLEVWVLSCSSHEEYCEKVGWERLRELSRLEQALNRIPSLR